MTRLRLRHYLAVLALVSAPALAGGLEQLHGFLRTVQSARGSFEQKVIAQNGRTPQASSGTFALQRPGRFRWSYERPYAQLLVSDGKTLWSWDPELKQAVNKAIGQALGGSPAELLAGAEFEKHFIVTEGGTADGLDFVDAQPKRDDSGFTRLRIGLAKNLPVLMELHDSFGQVTLLRFTRFEANPALASDLFRFSPPKGADVIGQ